MNICPFCNELPRKKEYIQNRWRGQLLKTCGRPKCVSACIVSNRTLKVEKRKLKRKKKLEFIEESKLQTFFCDYCRKLTNSYKAFKSGSIYCCSARCEGLRQLRDLLKLNMIGNKRDFFLAFYNICLKYGIVGRDKRISKLRLMRYCYNSNGSYVKLEKQ